MLIAGAVLVVVCASMVGAAAAKTGELSYPTDDTYIHMAMARHLVQHGVWGVTPYEFSHTSSSPLWTLLLAGAYRFVGIQTWPPLAICGIMALILLPICDRELRRAGAPVWWRAVVLIAIVLLTPVYAITILGMEHVVQMVLAVVVLMGGARLIATPRAQRLAPRDVVWLTPWMVLFCTTRYEGLFMAAVMGALLLWNRRWVPAVVLGAAAWAPVIVMGIYARAHGAHFLPNSLIVKGSGFNAHTLLGFQLARLLLWPTPHMLTLVVLVWLVWRVSRRALGARAPRAVDAAVILFFGTAALHLSFSSTGWFFRYEAYLVALGLLLVGVAAAPLVPKSIRLKDARPAWLPVFVYAVLMYPLLSRGLDAFTKTVPACTNVHDQPMMMSRFIKDSGLESVAANDIGAICFINDVHIVDLAGLGSGDVLELRRADKFDTAAIDSLCSDHGVRIAVVYRSWFKGRSALPPTWTRVGTWQLEHNVICGGDVVSFFAVEPQDAANFARKMRAFAPRLPPSETQRIEFASRPEPTP